MRSLRSRRMSLSWSHAILVAPAATGVGACSLINAFADLKLQADAGASDAQGDTTGGGLRSRLGPLAIPARRGFDSGFADKGVIVISGRVSDDAGNLVGVLTAIAPDTGMELPNAREELNVPVVLYDGLRDLWYVIETDGQSLFPAPTDHAVLHTRTLDPVSGTWKTLQSLQVPPPVFGLAAAITNRLVYVGYDPQVDAASGTSFVTIDTTDPDGAQPLRCDAASGAAVRVDRDAQPDRQRRAREHAARAAVSQRRRRADGTMAATREEASEAESASRSST